MTAPETGMAPDDEYYERALERIASLMLGFGCAGTIVLWAWGGWTRGIGFAVGAVASWLNYRWLKNVVDTLAGRRPKSGKLVIWAGLRYLLLGAGAYVILRYSPVSIAAALAGLFVSAAAVVIEILIELLYART
jgi:hypothetical protein